MNRADGLAGAVWREFERLRYAKTEALQQKFGSFPVYWSFLQASAGAQPAVVVMLDVVICL